MTDSLFLPHDVSSSAMNSRRAGAQVESEIEVWLNSRLTFAQEHWLSKIGQESAAPRADAHTTTRDIIKVLTHRSFNYKSKISLSHLLPDVEKVILAQVQNGQPLKFYLLYNGGYRASPFSDSLELNFDPDQTEMMLLYQISLLDVKISQIYPAGVDFTIVVNNGVALWVNEIALESTKAYSDRLRRMIKWAGAQDQVQVLLQSELPNFSPHFRFESPPMVSGIAEFEHQIVERFLGRTCSEEEAIYRSAIYQIAENYWAAQLSEIAPPKEVLMFRQIAHPEMLSFRPFPGGAIRIQNGSLGFQRNKSVLTPKLISSVSAKKYPLKFVNYRIPI